MSARVSFGRIRLFLLATWLLACPQTPETPAGQEALEALLACSNGDCQQGQIEKAWAEDSGAVQTWLATLEPAEVMVLVGTLSLAYPENAEELCEVLPEGMIRLRCMTRYNRPHLDNQHTIFRETGGGGEETRTRPMDLPVPPAVEVAWEDEAGALLLEGCVEGVSRDSCAQSIVISDDAPRTARSLGGICRAGRPETDSAPARFLSECLFKASEALIRREGVDALEEALTLCSHSSFGPMCTAHLIVYLQPEVPPSHRATNENVASSIEVARRLGEAVGPDLSSRYQDRFWSHWVATSVIRSATPSGVLLDLLPEAAHAHVPVSLAYAQMTRRTPRSLGAALADLESALAVREVSVAPLGRTFPGLSFHRRDVWGSVFPAERSLEKRACLGPGMRALAPDPSDDRKIAVLEAAAQLATLPPAPFFFEVVEDRQTSWVVRWTAARLGGVLYPEEAASVVVAEYRIKARLAFSVRRRQRGGSPGPGVPARRPNPGAKDAGGSPR